MSEIINRKEYMTEKAIQVYIKDFDRNNKRDGVSQRNETAKWTAVANFARYWDVEAADMSSMWKKCMNHAFIDTSRSYPTQGIAILLKETKEQDNVREAFNNLFLEDNGDLDKRWDRILEFQERINKRLKELFPNSKIYLQNKESVM